MWREKWKTLASGGQSSPKLTPTLSASSPTPKKGILTRTYFAWDQVPDCPDFTRAKKNKLPSWDKYSCHVTTRYRVLENVNECSQWMLWDLQSAKLKSISSKRKWSDMLSVSVAAGATERKRKSKFALKGLDSIPNKAKEPSLSYSSPIAGGWKKWIHTYPKVINAKWTQNLSVGVWNWSAYSILLMPLTVKAPRRKWKLIIRNWIASVGYVKTKIKRLVT